MNGPVAAFRKWYIRNDGTDGRITRKQEVGSPRQAAAFNVQFADDPGVNPPKRPITLEDWAFYVQVTGTTQLPVAHDSASPRGQTSHNPYPPTNQFPEARGAVLAWAWDPSGAYVRQLQVPGT